MRSPGEKAHARPVGDAFKAVILAEPCRPLLRVQKYFEFASHRPGSRHPELCPVDVVLSDQRLHGIGVHQFETHHRRRRGLVILDHRGRLPLLWVGGVVNPRDKVGHHCFVALEQGVIDRCRDHRRKILAGFERRLRRQRLVIDSSRGRAAIGQEHSKRFVDAQPGPSQREVDSDAEGVGRAKFDRLANPVRLTTGRPASASLSWITTAARFFSGSIR